MSPVILRSIFLLAILLWSPATVHACVRAVVTNAGTISYDPTDRNPILRPFQVRLEQICDRGGRANAEITFEDSIEAPPYSVIGGVPFAIVRRGSNLLGSPLEANPSRLLFDFNAAGEVFEFEVMLLPGFVAQSSTREIELVMAYFDETGTRVEQRIPVPISINARPAFSLRVAGGQAQGIVDFGQLSAGLSREIVLGATGTGRYRIEMSSQYNMALRRASPCGVDMPPPLDAADLVPYRAFLNGVGLEKERAVTGRQIAIGARVAEDPLTLAITIDPQLVVEKKRAGRYCDVITLTIRPDL